MSAHGLLADEGAAGGDGADAPRAGRHAVHGTFGMVARCLPRAKDASEIERVINAYFAAPTPSKDAWEMVVNLIVIQCQRSTARR